MRKFKVLLINPPLNNMVELEMSNSVIKAMGCYPPLGLLYVATYLKERAGFEVDVRILDCVAGKIDYPHLESEIRKFDPTLVGVSTSIATLIDSILTVRLAKKINKDIVTVVGGLHTESYPNETLREPAVDFIIRGEGEDSFLKLVNSIRGEKIPYSIDGIGFKDNGNIYINETRAYISDLDGLPLVNRSFVDKSLYQCSIGQQDYTTTLISSRGCPYECIFCSSPKKVYRQRSKENIIAEIKEIVGMGIREVFFVDDLFNISAEKVSDFARSLIKERLDIRWSFRGRINNVDRTMLEIAKKSGCQRIHYGIETSSNHLLSFLNKAISINDIERTIKLTREKGITTIGNFMIGMPGETKEEMRNTFKFARTLGLDYVEIGILTPYPDTKLYKDCLSKGIIKEDIWLRFASDPLKASSEFTSFLSVNELSRPELYLLVNEGYRKFYFRPGYILRSLLKINTLKEIFNKIRGALVILKESMPLKSNYYKHNEF